jgi:hypothetical protein
MLYFHQKESLPPYLDEGGDRDVPPHSLSQMACARTKLRTIDKEVTSSIGIVYSTKPRRAEGPDRAYFIKGPDVEDAMKLQVVFAEIAGCSLAREVGLVVPEPSACEFSGETCAGVARVVVTDRDVTHWLKHPDKVSNFPDLFNAVVVDIWLANSDRNMGGVLARQNGKVEFVFIDFEKSIALRPNPTISSSILDPRTLWPSDLLGTELQAIRPLHPPQIMINQIRQCDAAKCEEIVNDVVGAIGCPVPWKDDAIYALSNRAQNIQRLAEEVWATV